MKLSKNTIFKITMQAPFLAWIFILGAFTISNATQVHFPAPNPPYIEYVRDPSPDVSRSQPQAPAAAKEWTFHKTADNLHPSGPEQQMVWLMNRARANPPQEGHWLSHTNHPDVTRGLKFFKVDLTILQNEFIGYAAKPPAAFDARLYEAAKAHSEDLIARDAQDHDGQSERVEDAGFKSKRYRGNVYSYTETALHAHAAFNIDWGDDDGDGTGMQPERGHRQATMSIDHDYANVGFAIVGDADPKTKAGPWVTTGNFSVADSGEADHFNRFLVGTVWQDANDNDQYDPGEGMGGITVKPDVGSYHAVTANSGGYAFPAVSKGTYTVTFSGQGIDPAKTRIAVVDGSDSVLLDLKYVAGDLPGPEAVTDRASDVTNITADLIGTVYTNGHETSYHFEYGTTTNYGSTTAVDSVSTDTAVQMKINDLNPKTTYHFRLVAENNEGTHIGSDKSFVTAAKSTDVVDDIIDDLSNGGNGCFIMSAF